jgi:hypothetical protein
MTATHSISLQTAPPRRWRRPLASVAGKRAANVSASLGDGDRAVLERAGSCQAADSGRIDVVSLAMTSPTVGALWMPRSSLRMAQGGKPCRSPATKKGRCRLHGGANGSGGPHGKRNGQYRHGERTKAAIAERQKFSALLKMLRAGLT